MKKLFSLLTLFFCINATWAARTMYTVLDTQSGTLTFMYDETVPTSTETQLVYDGIYFYGKNWLDKASSIKTVVFDTSFADARTGSCHGWFLDCSALTEIQSIENLNTSAVTDMASMFAGCSSLTSLDLSGFNTDKVTDMASMFSGCSSLTSLDLSNFNTANVTNMCYMFDGCSSLISLDLSGFNTAKVTYMGSMFQNCSELTSLNLSGFSNDNVADMSYMFDSCSKLTSLNLSGFHTDKVTDMHQMFRGCAGLASLDLSGFNTTCVTTMGTMFYGCSSLTSLDLSNFKTDNVTNMGLMFYGCSGLTSLDLSNFNTANVGSMRQMFRGCSGLASLNLSGFSNDNVTDMGAMFYDCSSLTSLNLSNFDTANVTNMSYMFYGCSGLASLNLSGFSTANVTTMEGMFYGCSSLTSLDLSNFNTAKVTTMEGMFICSGLTSLDLSNFDTANVTSMYGMFYGCSSLSSLGLANFKTDNVEDMSYMFYGCSGLTSLNLSNFNTANVTTMESMFYGCSSLVTIYASDLFTIAGVTSSSLMFADCTSLVGAIPYDPNKTDASYANYTTGYFTVKDPATTDHDFTGEILFDNVKKIYYKVCQEDGCGLTKYFADAAGTIEAVPNEDETAFSVAKYDLQDATQYDNQAVFTATDFTYSRTFGGAEWTTWYVPFDLTLTAELCDKYAFSRINNVHQYDLDDNGVAEKTVVESFRQQPGVTLKANYPYLVKPLSGIDCDMVLDLTDVTLAQAETNSIDCQSVDFTYTFTGTYTEMGESGVTLYDPYTLCADETWQHFNSLEPMRHYLTVTPRHSASPAASVSSIVLLVIGDENVTGIVNVYGDERKAAETYDLSGRLLPAGSSQKGWVVKNGKVIYNP